MEIAIVLIVIAAIFIKSSIKVVPQQNAWPAREIAQVCRRPVPMLRKRSLPSTATGMEDDGERPPSPRFPKPLVPQQKARPSVSIPQDAASPTSTVVNAIDVERDTGVVPNWEAVKPQHHVAPDNSIPQESKWLPTERLANRRPPRTAVGKALFVGFPFAVNAVPAPQHHGAPSVASPHPCQKPAVM